MLKDLQVRCSATEFNNIMTCLQSPSITDYPEYRNWTPLSGRLKCFEKLRKHLELVYPISKDEVKVEPNSFMSFILKAIENNPNFANVCGKNIYSNGDFTNENQIEISLLQLINIDNSNSNIINNINNNNFGASNNNNNKGRKIYNANKNRIFVEDDLNNNCNFNNKADKAPKDENEAFLRKSNSSLKALRNERISQSLNLNKIAEIEQENLAEYEKAENNFIENENENENEISNNNNEEFANQLYEVYEANQKSNQAAKAFNKHRSDNLPMNSKAAAATASQYNFINNNNSKYNYYNNEINVIEEEERSKKDEEIDLDDIDEKMELNENNFTRPNNNPIYNNYNQNNINNNNNQNQEYNEKIMNKNLLKSDNNNSNNNNQINKKTNFAKNENENFTEEDSSELNKLNIIEDDQNEINNEINNNNNNKSFIEDNALSDLDKEEYFMKSCYDFFDYDITTLAERKVIEDSHPIRTSCFSSKGDYFAIGTNSKSIKLFHIKPVLQRFNKKNSYNFKSDLHNSNNLLYANNNNNYNNNLNQKSNNFSYVNNNKNNNNFNNNNSEAVDDIKMFFEQANHHMGSIYCLDWSLSGRLIASGSNDRLIKLMVVPSLDESLYGKDYETLELMISGHEGTVRSVCFEPTNDLILLSGGICIYLFIFAFLWFFDFFCFLIFMFFLNLLFFKIIFFVSI